MEKAEKREILDFFFLKNRLRENFHFSLNFEPQVSKLSLLVCCTKFQIFKILILGILKVYLFIYFGE